MEESQWVSDWSGLCLRSPYPEPVCDRQDTVFSGNRQILIILKKPQLTYSPPHSSLSLTIIQQAIYDQSSLELLEITLVIRQIILQQILLLRRFLDYRVLVITVHAVIIVFLKDRVGQLVLHPELRQFMEEDLHPRPVRQELQGEFLITHRGGLYQLIFEGLLSGLVRLHHFPEHPVLHLLDDLQRGEDILLHHLSILQALIHILHVLPQTLIPSLGVLLDIHEHGLLVLHHHLHQFLEVGLDLLDLLLPLLGDNADFCLGLDLLLLQVGADALQVGQELVHLVLTLVVRELDHFLFIAHKTGLNANCRFIQLHDFEALAGEEDGALLAVGDVLVLGLDHVPGGFGWVVVAGGIVSGYWLGVDLALFDGVGAEFPDVGEGVAGDGGHGLERGGVGAAFLGWGEWAVGEDVPV